MSLKESMAKIPQREQAGARTSNRFTYQQYWALDYILTLLRSTKSFLLIMEFHDDIFVADDSVNPQTVDFFQIKTDQSKPSYFSTSKITSSANKYPQKMSIAQKMIDNYTKFGDATNSLHLVSNKQFDLGEFPDGQKTVDRENIVLGDLSDEIRKKIQGGMCAACKDFSSNAEKTCKQKCAELVYFNVSSLALNSYDDAVFGRFIDYLVEYGIESTSSNSKAVFNVLLSEIRKCNNVESIPSNFNELITRKSIKKERFIEILEKLKDNSSAKEHWRQIEGFLLNESFGTLEIHRIGKQWYKYALDAMNPENLELQNLANDIRNVLCDSQYNTAREALKLTHEIIAAKYSLYSRDYLSAVILKEVYE